MSSRCGLLVGGTGLYHRAAIDSLDLAGRGQRSGGDSKRSRHRSTPSLSPLVELDPVAAVGWNRPTLDVVRALEVIEGSGGCSHHLVVGLTSIQTVKSIKLACAGLRGARNAN